MLAVAVTHEDAVGEKPPESQKAPCKSHVMRENRRKRSTKHRFYYKYQATHRVFIGHICVPLLELENS